MNTLYKTCTLVFCLTASWLGACCDSQVFAEQTLEEMQKIEKQIQNVVSKAMPAVVAVTDGQGFGSGVIVSKDGLVLTAGHVMASPFKNAYEVIFPNGHKAKAIPLGRNLNVDAGMVQIVDGGDYPYVDLAKSGVEIGEWVVTLGHSGGYDLGRKPPVRTGRVLGRKKHQIVTDAVLIGGDSGGPLFNLDGDVIAIHSSIGDSIAENRHVTIDTFRQHWTRMKASESWGQLPELAKKKKGKRRRARMGVVVDREANEAVVKEVHPNSPAGKAGIQTGDVITRFDNRAIANAAELISMIKTKRPNEGFNVEVRRNGHYFTTYVVLEGF